MSATRRSTLLVVSQVYVPDPASVGQHMHDVAREMVRRGHRVIVLTSDRGYENPALRYASRERLDGVEIRRLPWSSFGKSSLAVRIAGGGVFVAEALLAALALPRIDHVLVSTSPPMCGLLGVVLGKVRSIPMTFWAMDLNPDQIVATGALAAGALPVRAFHALNRRVLEAADSVVALDSCMAERLRNKASVDGKLTVIPPWPHVDATEPLLEHTDNPFRVEHGLQGKLVVMYSGNLSPTHPVRTILDAALRMRHEPRLLFLFVGGGLGRDEIERYVATHRLENVRTLPYQPLERLRESLSAADVHLVAMGDAMVGIVHPSKIYGAMAVGRPILVLGPRQCPLTDLVLRGGVGWQIEHGDAAAAAQQLRAILAMGTEELSAMGHRARALVAERFSRQALRGKFCDLLEQTAPASRGVEPRSG